MSSFALRMESNGDFQCEFDKCANANNANANTESQVNQLVKDWGYADLLPENQPVFETVPYHVHIFMGVLLTLLLALENNLLNYIKSI